MKTVENKIGNGKNSKNNSPVMSFADIKRVIRRYKKRRAYDILGKNYGMEIKD